MPRSKSLLVITLLILTRTSVPKFNGTFELAKNEAEIKTRPYRASTTNVSGTTDAKFYLRTRKRNVERQAPFIRSGKYQNDCDRVQEVVNNLQKVDYEQFDFKAFENHRFRDV